MDQSFFAKLLENLWEPATFLKLLFIAVTSPYWLPLARAMYREFLPALNSPEEGSMRRPPGEDPFLNIPTAAWRARITRESGRTSRRGR